MKKDKKLIIIPQWRLFSNTEWLNYKREVNDHRQKLGFEPFSDDSVYNIIDTLKIPCMNNWSKYILNQPPDW